MKSYCSVKSTVFASAIFLVAAVFPASPVLAESTFYQVSGVDSDDSLNMRSGAGTSYPVIGTIPPNGRTILTTGKTLEVGNSTWAEVAWLGQIGWVNQHYLALSDDQVQQTAGNQQSAGSHTHPANQCTRSITHTHPNGENTHQHNYSCQRNNQQTQTADANAHTHPRNSCTNSISHSHPNGANTHNHRYSCSQAMARPKYQPQPKYTNY